MAAPSQYEPVLFAVAIGAGLIFSVNESIRTGQGLPRGLFVVAYNVTTPTSIYLQYLVCTLH
jgi:hypothetical protein